MFDGSLYNVYMVLFHTHNVGLFLYYVYVDEAMSEDLHTGPTFVVTIACTL